MSISSSVEKVKDLKITLNPLKSVLDCNDEIVTVWSLMLHGLFSEGGICWDRLRGARILWEWFWVPWKRLGNHSEMVWESFEVLGLLESLGCRLRSSDWRESFGSHFTSSEREGFAQCRFKSSDWLDLLGAILGPRKGTFPLLGHSVKLKPSMSLSCQFMKNQSYGIKIGCYTKPYINQKISESQP